MIAPRVVGEVGLERFFPVPGSTYPDRIRRLCLAIRDNGSGVEEGTVGRSNTAANETTRTSLLALLPSAANLLWFSSSRTIVEMEQLNLTRNGR